MSSDAILVFNCGSSSIKFSLFSVKQYQKILSGIVDKIGQPDCLVTFYDKNRQDQKLENGSYQDALSLIMSYLQKKHLIKQIIAIGHRVVHGGKSFNQPSLINDKIIEQLKSKNMDIEKAYWPVLEQRRIYGARLSVINQVPILFAVYIVNGDLSTKELLVIIMTINNISGTFQSIFRFIGCFERWKSDAHDIFDFYNENEQKEIIDCVQYTFPEQVQLVVDYTLQDTTRSFHLNTTHPIHIKYGDKILVDGVSGSGKTTLNRILAGYYETGGTITELCPNKYPHGFHHFRDVVCEISAGNFSSIDFCTSVRDQMTCVEDISEKDIWEILEIVCMKDWVKDELGGLDTNVKGHISDGQKLRLSLAVLLTQTYSKNVNIMIMDEIDQKVEETTAKKIVDNIFRKYHDKTIFMVFHTQSLKDHVQFHSVINVTEGRITQSVNAV